MPLSYACVEVLLEERGVLERNAVVEGDCVHVEWHVVHLQQRFDFFCGGGKISPALEEVCVVQYSNAVGGGVLCEQRNGCAIAGWESS